MDGEERAFRWSEWDWRPLARLVGWAMIACLWARHRGVAPGLCAAALLRQLLLLWLLSFGVLTYLLALVAMGLLQAAMFLDDATYELAERLVRPFVGAAPFVARFFAAFGAQIALVMGATWTWRALTIGPRLLSALAEFPR